MLSITYDGQFIIRNEFIRRFVLILLLAIALGIRVIGITRIPMNYHPIKQYRSALTARAFYFSMDANVGEWEKQVAASSLERIGFLGPPFVDIIAAGLYSLLGREVLWIAKLMSTLYWITGGIFLYATARRMMSEDAAILSTSIFLFLPFGVTSSQSFQPDPLMIMLMIISLHLIVSHHERPSLATLSAMSMISGIAILSKPVCVFILFGAFFALQYHREGLHGKFFLNRNTIVFILIALLPSLLYYGYGILNTVSLDQQAQKSFIPRLFLNFNFWDGWLKRIRLAVGFSMFLGGLLGVLLYPNRWQKTLLFGLWIGYFAMCFAFNYTISTHDYYHLPLFPIIALSFGSFNDLLIQNLRKQANNRFLEAGIFVILVIALFLSAGTSVQALGKLPDYSSEIERNERVGEAVLHSTNTIFLAPDDGKPLMYYGKIAGQYWPYWYDIRDEKLWGIPAKLPQERLEELGQGIDPEYFIVTDFKELETQSDLKQYLSQTYPILVSNSDYLIYKLEPKQ